MLQSQCSYTVKKQKTKLWSKCLAIAPIIVMTITSGISLVICSTAAMLVYGKEVDSKMIDRKPRYSTKFN